MSRADAVSGFAILQAATGLIFAIAVFWLPYYVPISATVASLSADIGFSNLAALLLALTGIAVLTLERLTAKQVPAPSQPIVNPEPLMTTSPLLALGLLQTVITLYLFFLTRNHYLGEGNYYLSRLYDIQSGLKLYRDFQFNYGPGLLYIPYWLHKVFGLSMRAAYWIILYAFQIGGISLLWCVIRNSTASSRTQGYSFLILSLPYILGVSLAPQYTAVRFVAPFAALLLIAAVTSKKGTGRFFRLILAYAASLVAMFLIFPEAGLSFVPAAFVYSYFTLRHEPRQWMCVGLSLVLALAIMLSSLNGNSTLWEVVLGGGNFPMIPSPFTLLYLFLLFAIVPKVTANAMFPSRQDAGQLPYSSPLVAAFVVQTITMSPGAFARAEGWDIYGYGTGVLLLCLLSLNMEKTRSWVYSAAILLIFAVLLPIGGVLVYREVFYLSRAAFLRWTEAYAPVGITNWLSRHVNGGTPTSVEKPDYRLLLPYGKVCVPFGEPSLIETAGEHYLLQADYLDGMLSLFSLRDAERKIADVKSCRYAVATPFMFGLPYMFGFNPPSDEAANRAESRWIRMTHFTLVPLHPKRSSFQENMGPFFTYMHTHFCPIAKVGEDYMVYQFCGASHRAE